MCRGREGAGERQGRHEVLGGVTSTAPVAGTPGGAPSLPSPRSVPFFLASLPWTLFTSLLTHRLVLLCVDAYCFIFWDLPGDVRQHLNQPCVGG